MKATLCFSALCLALSLVSVQGNSCTSIIISGKVRQDGKPLMFKHRDCSNKNNKIEYFRGEKYVFLGLVNDNWRTKPIAADTRGIPEVWAGRNNAGFCIMNTATYDLKDDDIPASMMDHEGTVMYRALEICATAEDFEHYLDTLSRPLYVECNFGVTDSKGNAAYYEVNNHKWVKFDVNEAPGGYMVVTNFTRTGRVADRKGEDRYEKAMQILSNTSVPIERWDHSFLVDNISRSGAPILRPTSNSVIIFEGDEIWACLGKPDRVKCQKIRIPFI